MFGVFGADVFMVVVMCIAAVLVGVVIGGILILMTGLADHPIEGYVFAMTVIVVGGLGCTYAISQPDGYVGEAKYVENTVNYEGGSGSAVPIVEVEGKGRFQVNGSGIVSYEIGDMVPVECYFDTCKVK